MYALNTCSHFGSSHFDLRNSMSDWSDSESDAPFYPEALAGTPLQVAVKEALGSSLNAVRKAETNDAKLSGWATTLLHGILGMDVNEMRTTMIDVMPTIMHRDELALAIRNVEAAIEENYWTTWTDDGLQASPLPFDLNPAGAMEEAIASALSLNTASEDSEAEQAASQESGVLQNSSGAVRAKAPGVDLSEALQNSSAAVRAKAPGMYLSSKPKANGLLAYVPPEDDSPT